MKKLFVIVLAAIGMVSCMNTDEVIEVNNDNAIAFADAFIENSVRAEITTNDLNQFNVWGWMQEDAVTATVFEGKEVTYTDGVGWTYSPAQYWVPGFTYTFQALSSNLAEVDRNWAATATEGKVGVVTFENVDGTEDLIYATATVDAPALGQTKTVALKFDHQLAKVKFTFAYTQLSAALGNGMSVKAENIKMVVPAKGKIDYSATTPAWELVGTETTELVFEAAGDELLTIPAEDYTYAISFDVNLYKEGRADKVKTLVTKTSSVVLDVVKGCAYNFAATLTPENLQMDSIDFTPEVNPWSPGGDAEFTTDTDTPTTAPVISNDEIWYTNGSTTEPTIPYATDVFGVNIISNTYDMDKGCWVIKLDGSATEIGLGAFSYSKIESIVIPNGVAKIGRYAFYRCLSLESVIIGDSVSEIGDYAFQGCSKIKNIIIPNSVTSIAQCAFQECSSLESVTIPDSVTSIGNSAFFYCSSDMDFKGKFASADGRCLIIDGVLKFFTPANLTEYTIPNGVIEIGWDTFNSCLNITKITIPDGVTSIRQGAFAGCSNLTSINIPNSVTLIGTNAFSGCSALPIEDNVRYADTYLVEAIDKTLSTYNVKEGTKFIGNYAFRNCSSLASITIPDSVTSIGADAFSYCQAMKSVTIGDSVTSIGEWAFHDCSSLASVYCKPTTPPQAVWDNYGGWDAFSENASGRKIYVPAESVDVYKSAQHWSNYADHFIGYYF